MGFPFNEKSIFLKKETQCSLVVFQRSRSFYVYEETDCGKFISVMPDEKSVSIAEQASFEFTKQYSSSNKVFYGSIT